MPDLADHDRKTSVRNVNSRRFSTSNRRLLVTRVAVHVGGELFSGVNRVQSLAYRT